MLPAFYPRLHRLSVLNIIYHGSFDYQLNPWCTSFAGDSGVGKSLIADLLQLIFVGKGEYRSATKGQDDRPPEGLVLNDDATNGKGLGYAFLSIEVAAGRFLIVGCYLAAAARLVVPFIVQQGISFSENLVPLHQPLSYHDLLPDDNRVLPLADMAAHVRQRLQATIKFFEHRQSEFHRLLYNNHLLPLDVNQPGVLRSYANIIQSFSRGIDFDYHQNPDKLKKFLFGEEAQRDILRDYERRTDDIRQQLADYQTNGLEATKLEEKLLRFNSLHHKHQTWQQARLALLRDQLGYWQGEVLRAESQAKQLAGRLQTGETAYRQLQLAKCQFDATAAAQTQQRHRALLAEQSALTEEAERQQQAQQTALKLQEKLRPATDQAHRYNEAAARVAGWLARYGPVTDLRQTQRRHQQHRHEQELLRQLDEHLHATGQQAFFPESVWAQAATPAAAEAALRALREQAAASQREQLFADLDDPNSLAGWALRRGQSLTLAEESVLAYFGQQASWREQEAGLYLHSADELFTSPLVTVDGEHNPGFWLHLRGVRVWVPRLEEADRAFFDANKARIKRLFAARRQAASHDLSALNTHLAREEALANTWAQLTDWQAALSARPRREAIQQAAAANDLPTNETFEEQLALYETDAPGRASHKLALRQAAEVAGAVKTAQDALAVNKFRQEQANDDLAGLPKTDATAVARAEAAMQQAAQALADWLQKNQLATTMLPYQEDALAALAGDRYELGVAVSNQEKDLERFQMQLAQAKKLAEECDEEYERCHVRYRELTNKPVPDTLTTVPPPAEVPDTAAADTAQRAYEQEFDQLSASLSTSLARRPVYDDGPALLMRELLPEVLHGVAESEEALRLVSERLQRINENNRLIARLKIEQLQHVFEKVHKHYYEYVEEAKHIRTYFLGKKVQITGGFKPELKVGLVPEYPLEWMTIFGQLLREQASHPAQFARLGEAESLEELMCQAYKHQGGSLDRPRVADLLNPRSYLSLEFGMGSARVKANKGSTGQTFMAVALLNIARLSIIGGGEQRPGIRFMPVDEAAGLGSNYAVLLALARDKSYQVISLSPEPIIDEASEQHRAYFLAFDPAATELNLHPMMLNMQQKLVPVPAPLAFAQTLFDNEPDQPAATA